MVTRDEDLLKHEITGLCTINRNDCVTSKTNYKKIKLVHNGGKMFE